MFNIFRRNASKSQLRPPRAPGDTIRQADAAALRDWAQGREFVEAYIEPETVVNEMSVVVVDEQGDYIRRRIGGPKGIDAVAKLLGCPVFDAEETGYPQRMRERMERERVLRRREEQRQRRERFSQGRNPETGEAV
ncbi:oxidoreductase [Corynebacterium lizhenjunii]|uniref:Oxidoreductase n=1 Tax=Corynebacterium lizhenjunii TaxID=2709394 RepID=A0A7T0KE10_9CORY|nr:oxidoreductase [Corynebacterium lizhenjunii]QPK78535.1 oxidoreductase [Corynebacterium lizhenjunii]